MNANVFESCREVKWCPGCGNYAILMTVQKTLHALGISNKNTVFVSGIGCSGRFPYYINSYGFHTLHGRAPAIASGLCLSRPDLNVWLVVGDGDGFSIGLGHVLHMIRRNININVLFINNKIYALTKGQYSPTSNFLTVTKSSPLGSFEKPINPILMDISAGCTFIARAVDNDFVRLRGILESAINHNGVSFIEILQNCNVYNNKSFFDITDSEDKLNKIIYLRNNEQLIFGKNGDKCLTVNKQAAFEVCDINTLDQSSLPLYNIKSDNFLHFMLASLAYDDMPFPLGIFRDIDAPTYEDQFFKSVDHSSFINFNNFLSKI